MSLLLGLDIASVTGFAWYEPPSTNHVNHIRSALSRIEVGSFRITGDEFEDRAGDMGQRMIGLIKPRRPALVVIEQPTRNVMQHKKTVQDFSGEHEEKTINAGTALLLNQLTGAAVAIVRAYNVPFIVVPSSTWRKAAYGFGTHRGWVRKDWKKHAREKCAEHHIVVTNDDQAEAVWIAKAGERDQRFRYLGAKAA